MSSKSIPETLASIDQWATLYHQNNDPEADSKLRQLFQQTIHGKTHPMLQPTEYLLNWMFSINSLTDDAYETFLAMKISLAVFYGKYRKIDDQDQPSHMDLIIDFLANSSLENSEKVMALEVLGIDIQTWDNPMTGLKCADPPKKILCDHENCPYSFMSKQSATHCYEWKMNPKRTLDLVRDPDTGQWVLKTNAKI